MPVDPLSDGTWIAASDAGLVLVLMTSTFRPATRRVPAPSLPSALADVKATALQDDLQFLGLLIAQRFNGLAVTAA